MPNVTPGDIQGMLFHKVAERDDEAESLC